MLDEIYFGWLNGTFLLVRMLTIVIFHVIDLGEQHKIFPLQFGSLGPGFQVFHPFYAYLVLLMIL